MTLTEENLEQVHDYLIKVLPTLLRRDPSLVTTITWLGMDGVKNRNPFSDVLGKRVLFMVH